MAICKPDRNEKEIMQIYTDGSCGQGKGPGGWAFVVLNGKEYVSGDYEGIESTSIGFLEAMAILKALSWCQKFKIPSVIYSDSMYIVNAVNEWIPKWKKNGWRRSKNQPVLNLELIKQIDLAFLDVKHFVRVEWVKGHSNNYGNEMADRMANFAKENIKKNLQL
jgi:ribonuclease HI